MRKGLDEPRNYGNQGLLKICSTASMELGGEVKCKDEWLQLNYL